MKRFTTRAYALLLGVSGITLAAAAQAQQTTPNPPAQEPAAQQGRQAAGQQPAQRSTRQRTRQQASRQRNAANSETSSQEATSLPAITVVAPQRRPARRVERPQEPVQTTMDAVTPVATKTDERAVDTLAAVSVRQQEDFNQLMPSRVSDLFFAIPGVSFSERGDDPASAINIRGLQDFGRVAVTIDGARQNFQKSGHNANGAFYLEPELLSSLDVVRGPVANIYGSGAIGGVVSFTTKDVNDILKPGERWGILGNGMFGSNEARGGVSMFGASRVTPDFDIFAGATYRSSSAFRSGSNGGPIAGIAAALAPGLLVPNSANEVATGIAKATMRPADGHEIKITGMTLHSDFLTTSGNTLTPSSSQFSTQTRNDVVSARWRYGRPDDKLLNWDANVYFTDTDQKQLKVAGATSTSTGAIGDVRTFNLQTFGTDINNTSRLDFGALQNAFTYGVDAFHDEVRVSDPGGAQDSFTPSGGRTVYGGFFQWKGTYANWVQVIAAGRYDGYELNGNGVGSSGNRFSPKITVGLLPNAPVTPYATYAEGYRAPALTETIVAGDHPPFASFPGAPGGFTFVPNPNLRPEVGHTKEVGVNFKFDNLMTRGDKLRAKLAVFRNDVDDFINAVQFGPLNFWGQPSFYQYQNVSNGRLQGVEFESMYDAGLWFAGVSVSHVRGTDLSTGLQLANIPADQVATTLGVRLLEQKLTASVRWAAVAAKTSVAPGFIPTPAYNLVNMYVSYQPVENVLAGISVENLLNQYYVRYPEFFPSPGLTVKGSLRIRLAGGA